MAIQTLEDMVVLRRGKMAFGAGRQRSAQATVDLPAGVLCALYDAVGSGELKGSLLLCRPPTSAAEATGDVAVSIYRADRPFNDDGFEWQTNDVVDLRQKGPITVVTEEAVLKEDPVYVRFATKAGNTQLGAFRNDADGDPAEILLLTSTSTADADIIHVAIDGVSFHVLTGSSESANDKAVLVAAAIDAHAAFVATAPGAGVINVTRADGGQPVATFLETGVTAAYDTDADPATCVLLPGWRWVSDFATGLATVDFDL